LGANVIKTEGVKKHSPSYNKYVYLPPVFHPQQKRSTASKFSLTLKVMQRVIGDAMNVTNANAPPVTPTITTAVVGQSGGSRGTRSATANAKSHASVNAGGGTKGGKQKALNSTLNETTLAMPKTAAKTLLTSVKSEPKNAASAIAVPTMTPLSHAPHHHSSSSTAKPFTPEEQELVTELEASSSILQGK
jgi:hypothetical protein